MERRGARPGQALTPEHVRRFSQAFDAEVGTARELHISPLPTPGTAFLVIRNGQVGQKSEVVRIGQPSSRRQV